MGLRSCTQEAPPNPHTNPIPVHPTNISYFTMIAQYIIPVVFLYRSYILYGILSLFVTVTLILAQLGTASEFSQLQRQFLLISDIIMAPTYSQAYRKSWESFPEMKDWLWLKKK